MENEKFIVAAKSEEYIGYIDTLTEAVVSGWVLIRRNKELGFPIPVLYINGKIIGKLKLTGSRPDATKHFGREAIGIYIKLTRYLLDGTNVVEIKFDETGEILQNGRHIIEFNRDIVAGKHWSKEYSDNSNLSIRWWQSDHIVRAINKRMCGKDIPGLSWGFYQLIKRDYKEILPMQRGISVGGGCGQKEMDAISERLVSHVDLYEVSKEAIKKGRQIAKDRGLETQITFHLADAFTAVTFAEAYDLVYWNNSLHHMSDTREAIKWSHRVLKKGGLFLMDDYVGENRMQFPKDMLQVSDAFRNTLPSKYFQGFHNPKCIMDRQCVKPDEDDLVAIDPSECTDSINILPALRDIFPGVKIILTGGGVYHLGLSDVLHNIIKANDIVALDRAMLFDDICLKKGLTQYAVAYGIKQ